MQQRVCYHSAIENIERGSATAHAHIHEWLSPSSPAPIRKHHHTLFHTRSSSVVRTARRSKTDITTIYEPHDDDNENDDPREDHVDLDVALLNWQVLDGMYRMLSLFGKRFCCQKRARLFVDFIGTLNVSLSIL
jgi:hypothetical protein